MKIIHYIPSIDRIAGGTSTYMQVLGKELGKLAEQLAEAMSWCNENIHDIRSNRSFRMKWAENHLSGKAVAKYMIDCLEKTSK